MYKVYFGLNWTEGVQKTWDVNKNKALASEIDFTTYWQRALDNPRIAQNSTQRIYEMIMAAGTETKKVDGREVTTYNFFERPDDPDNALIGMEKVLDEFVQHLHQAAMGTKVGQRLIMAVGGPGSGKSTLVHMIKTGLNNWSKDPRGEFYALKWVNLPEDFKLGKEFADPLKTDPINVIPREHRKEFEAALNKSAKKAGMGYGLRLKGEMSPTSLWIRDQLLKKYDYDLEQVIKNHVKATRVLVDEDKRVGVGTFEARDPKSLDATQLVGGVSYTRLADFDGDESDPRAYDFHTGELFIANRGVMEMIEALKLPQEFLYVLFSLAQERKVKADKMPLVSVDETVFAHSNGPDYQAMKDNPSLVALPSRMRIFKFPYPTDMSAETRIYQKDYLPIAREQGIEIAPHALEMAALWATMTRYNDPKDGDASFLVKKAKLYSGMDVKGYTPNSVLEMKAQSAEEDEGLTGISPREMQSLLPQTLTNREVRKLKTVDGALVLNLIEERLKTGFFNITEDEKQKYLNLLTLTKQEYNERLKEDVMEALTGDIARLKGTFDNFLDNVSAYCNNEEIMDPHTYTSAPPDEKFMRSIEMKMGIEESNKHMFRHRLMGQIGSRRRDGGEFTWETSEELRKAIVAKVFEDSKDSLNLKEDNSTIIQRLKEKGYNDVAARNALARVRKLENK